MKNYDLNEKIVFSDEKPINKKTISEQPIASDFKKCLNWSQLLNEARTYFEQNPE